jgi:prophage tail gpP-like protein
LPTTQNRDAVSLLIEGKRFAFWSDLEIHLSVDAYSAISLSAPFEAERREFRDTFRPFTFKPISALIGGDTLFKGTMIGIDPSVTPEARTVQAAGYALPGVLADCHAPVSALPLEFKKLGLRGIAETLAGPFGLGVEFRAEEGTPFDLAALDIDKKPHEFLSDLARQRNLVLSNTAEGKLLCWKSVAPGNPVATFAQGKAPLGVVTATFSPQEYYSEITGFAPTKKGRKGAAWTARNPFLQAVLRPHSVKLDDTEVGDIHTATLAKLGRMFANMASYEIADLPTWRDPNGKVWQPNTTLKLRAPDAMIYRQTELLIRDVWLRQSADVQTATLGLVLPGAFSGEVPSVLPWDE